MLFVKTWYLVLVFFIYHSNATDLVLQCQNENDYLVFLYNLCLKSPPCKQPFHLSPINTNVNTLVDTEQKNAFIRYTNERNFQLFRSQLNRKQIFPITTTTSSSLQATTEKTIFETILPSEWLPTIQVNINANANIPCSSENYNASNSIIIASLYAMSIYKLTMVDEFFCHDHNERLFLSPSGEINCQCKEGKSCDNDSHTDELLKLLIIFLIFAIALLIAFLLYSLYSKKLLIDKVAI